MSHSWSLAARTRVLAGGVAAVALTGETAIAIQSAAATGHVDAMTGVMIVTPILAAGGLLLTEYTGATGAWFKTIGIGIAALAVTAVVVLGSAHRTGGLVDAGIAVQQQRQAAADDLDAEIAAARKERDALAASAAAEAAAGGCGGKCKGLMALKQAADARILDLGRSKGTLQPAYSGNAELDRLSQILRVPVATLAIYVPLLLPIGLNLLAVFGLTVALAPPKAVPVPVVDAPPLPDVAGLLPAPGQASLSHDERALLAALADGAALTNQQLAVRMGVSEGEASKRVAACSHLVSKGRDGRTVRIGLATTATAARRRMAR